ncbi:MAG: bifunctional DNA primase/polymerase, partial [candidate division WOR-3 bacterium]
MNKESKLIELFYTMTKDDIYFNLKHIINFIENVDLLIPIRLERKENSHKFAKRPLVKWKTTDKEKVIQVIKSEYPCGIAIVLDNYDFVVLDIDNVELFEKEVVTIEELLNERNYIACVKTISGGYHFYLRRSEYEKLIDFSKVNNKNLIQVYGFELRREGLLLIPGSLSESGQYELLDLNFESESTVINVVLNLLLKLDIEDNEFDIEDHDTERNKERIKHLVSKIKREIKFDDFDFMKERKVKDYSNYTLYHCPIHPPDKKPSFAVYKNPGGEIAVDFHDYTKYDIITFFAKYENINIKDAILRLSKLIEKQDENQNNITIPELFDEPKPKKKKKKTIEDVDLNELKRVFIDIFNIEKVEFYYNEKREKYYRFYTKHTEFDIKSSDLLELDSFLKCYFNYHVRIPRAWYYSEYKSDISLFFEEVMQEIVETASEIVDIKLESIVDTIVFILKHAPVAYDLPALRSDFLNIVKYGSNYVFRFESLLNTLARFHSIKIKTNELAHILSINNIAKKGERVRVMGDRIR